MTVDEVTDLLHCHRITVLRLIRRGQLCALQIAGRIRFERVKVVALNNRKIAVYPHLTVISRAGLAKRVLPMDTWTRN